MEETEDNIKRKRKSIITIMLVVLILFLLAILTQIIISKLIVKNGKENEDEKYVTHLDEEDLMVGEYKYLNKKLDNLYAFGIVDNYIVGVKGIQDIEKIIEIDSNKEYDYLYYKRKLYLLNKIDGIIDIVALDKEEYNIEDTILLNTNVDSFEVYNNIVFYISNNKLYKYENGTQEEINSNLTSKKLILKNEELFFVKENNLIKMDFEKNEDIILKNVNDINYYNYYERNKLIIDTQEDEDNVFKKVYNFYTGEIYNSIKNNVYLIPFNSSDYIYVTNDCENIMSINKSGNSKYILDSDSKINQVVFLKEKYLLVERENDNILINLSSNEIEKNDNVMMINNIRYLK